MNDFYVYIILSKTGIKTITYVGYTKNLQKRLKLHNSSKGAKFTKGKKWKYIYTRKYNNKSEAMKNEYLLKKDRLKRNFIKSKFV